MPPNRALTVGRELVARDDWTVAQGGFGRFSADCVRAYEIRFRFPKIVGDQEPVEPDPRLVLRAINRKDQRDGLEPG